MAKNRKLWNWRTCVFTDDTVLIQNEINALTINPSFNVLKLQDDLMAPFYKEGDIVAGVKITAENQLSLYQGCVCIMESQQGIFF